MAATDPERTLILRVKESGFGFIRIYIDLDVSDLCAGCSPNSGWCKPHGSVVDSHSSLPAAENLDLQPLCIHLSHLVGTVGVSGRRLDVSAICVSLSCSDFIVFCVLAVDADEYRT